MIPTSRMIHTKIWQSEQFLKLKPYERLLHIGLITLGDDHGRLRGDGRYLKRQLFYYDRIGVPKIEKMRDAIHNSGLITVYCHENSIFIAHPNWKRYQKLRTERTKDSEYPAPPSDVCQTSACHIAAEVKVSEESINEVKLGQNDGSYSHISRALSPHAKLMREGMRKSNS